MYHMKFQGFADGAPTPIKKGASIAKDIQISDIHCVTQEKTGRVNTKALKERVSGYILNLDTWLFDRIKHFGSSWQPFKPWSFWWDLFEGNWWNLPPRIWMGDKQILVWLIYGSVYCRIYWSLYEYYNFSNLMEELTGNSKGRFVNCICRFQVIKLFDITHHLLNVVYMCSDTMACIYQMIQYFPELYCAGFGLQRIAYKITHSFGVIGSRATSSPPNIDFFWFNMPIHQSANRSHLHHHQPRGFSVCHGWSLSKLFCQCP